MIRLIVNADDFGLTPGVNRSVAELRHCGALSSATLMATGAFFEDAVALAQATPQLEVGCHILLVDGTPVLPPSEIRSLVTADRQFRPALSGFVSDLYRRRIREAEIEAEATVQIRRLQVAGLRVSHVDTHKHTHLFPPVLRAVLRAAKSCGVTAIRNPFEPQWALRATAGSSRLRRIAVLALGSQRRAFHRLVAASGLATTGGTIGVLATGTRDVPGTLRALLEAIRQSAQNGAPEQVWELVCHPGYVDEHLDAVRTRLRASRAQEHEALLELIPRSGIALGSWRELPRALSR